MKDLININGVITPLEDAKISATDRGFLFADNIFETLVAFDGKILNLKKHLERLRISAENMQIPIPWSDEELEFELKIEFYLLASILICIYCLFDHYLHMSRCKM